jgi:hypothetical protein
VPERLTIWAAASAPESLMIILVGALRAAGDRRLYRVQLLGVPRQGDRPALRLTPSLARDRSLSCLLGFDGSGSEAMAVLTLVLAMLNAVEI